MSPREKLVAENYSEAQVAELLSVTVKTLRTYHSEGKDVPPRFKIGRESWYKKTEVHAWLAKRPVQKAVS